MTTITLPNWLLIIVALNYGVVGTLYVIRFFVDIWDLKRKIALEAVIKQANESNIETNQVLQKEIYKREMP